MFRRQRVSHNSKVGENWCITNTRSQNGWMIPPKRTATPATCSNIYFGTPDAPKPHLTYNITTELTNTRRCVRFLATRGIGHPYTTKLYRVLFYSWPGLCALGLPAMAPENTWPPESASFQHRAEEVPCAGFASCPEKPGRALGPPFGTGSNTAVWGNG